MHDLGQYLERDSYLHRLDSRVKLLVVMALSLFTLHLTLPGLLLIVGLIGGLCLLGKISPRLLWRTTKPVWPFFIALFLVYVLFTPGTLQTPALLSFYVIDISPAGSYLGLSQVLRFLLLVMIAALLTMTTGHRQLIMALEYLLQPLKIFRISPRHIALMVGLALRFVPTLQQEFSLIKQAAQARGLDLGNRRGRGHAGGGHRGTVLLCPAGSSLTAQQDTKEERNRFRDGFRVDN